MDDALRPAPDASYEAQAAREPMDADDLEVAARMLGRPSRGRPAVAVRCGWGLPAVLRVDPALEDGTPFPTTFWLACPLANKHCGRLEAQGAMVGLNERLAADADLADGYAQAHERYVAFRDTLGPKVPRDASAGGMPGRVKCLHSLYGHHLATGDNPIGAWVAEHVEPMACPAPCVELPASSVLARGASVVDAQRARVVAAVDCGTNSTRLLVARSDGHAVEPIVRQQVVTRFGRGVDASGLLSDDAIARTVEVIAGYADIWRQHGAEDVRIVATSAARDAGDAGRFVDAVGERVGVGVDILSGSQEASLAFAGAMAALDVPRPALVLDIGGGSTELIVGNDEPEASISLQLGSVRLTERCLGGDPPTPEELAAARLVVEAEMERAQAAVGGRSPTSLVALSGTPVTLAALRLGLGSLDEARVDGAVLTRGDVEGLVETLRSSSAAAIAALGAVERGREDVLLAGALILAGVMDTFDLERAVVGVADLLDGACRSMAVS